MRTLAGMRRKLLDDTRIHRYVLYAIGEVLLVMFGILAALQINARYENRKDLAYERTMLTSIRRATADGLALIDQTLLPRLETGRAASRQALTLLLRRGAPTDTLREVLHQSRTWILLSFNRGPYDALRATGLDKVRNDSLRAALIEFYDYRLPRVVVLLESLSRDLESQRDAWNELWTLRLRRVSDDSTAIELTIDDLESKKPQLVQILSVRRFSQDQAEMRLTPLQREATELLTLLDKELGLPATASKQ